MNQAETFHNGRICLIEDDEVMRRSLCQRFRLERLGHDSFTRLSEAESALAGGGYDLLLSDIRLPDGDASDLFRRRREEGHPLPPTLFITGYPDLEQAVELLRLGANDYIAKPFDITELLDKLRGLAPALFQGSTVLDTPYPLGTSAPMQRIEGLLSRLSGHAVAVLITGESGVGKEYAARYLHHRRHPDKDGGFLAINCAAVPEPLMEAELFGVNKGAFTGAHRSRPGLFERARGGTLFLDEIGEMPPAMQAKLLRVLQERTVTHLGGGKEIRVDLDVISATNRDLRSLVDKGDFREDLYYRLHVVHLEIPPLRERAEDVVWLAQRVLEAYGRRHPPRRVLSPAAQRYLCAQPWPGNARELVNTLERTLIFSSGSILSPADFREPDGHRGAQEGRPADLDLGLREYLAESERWYVWHILERHGWRMAETAAALNISRKNLWERMQRLGIDKQERK